MTTTVQKLPSSGRSRAPHVVFVAVSPIQVLDLAGPFEVFSRVARFGLARGYQLTVVGAGGVEATCGLAFTPTTDYRAVTGTVDTLIVVGGEGVEEERYDEAFVRWVRDRARRARRIASVCTGAFLLGEAGLLDGRDAVTHWAYCDALARRYRRVRVDANPIYVRDGNVYTSAGVMAGIDLALALVEEDYGPAVALRIAKELVLYLRRSGNQAQFSTLLTTQTAGSRSMADLVTWLHAHLDRPLTVDDLAEHAAMSPRNFARVFKSELGESPGRFLETLRLERAKEMLESTATDVKAVASACGFGDPSTLRRAFKRRVQATPEDYRARFSYRSRGFGRRR